MRKRTSAPLGLGDADQLEQFDRALTCGSLAGTRLVRAFNITGAGVFTKESNRPDPKMAIPIAGDDAEAVRVADGLVRDAGFEPVLVGKLVDARKFQQRGGPGYGQVGTAAELRQKLGMAQ